MINEILKNHQFLSEEGFLLEEYIYIYISFIQDDI